jgi:hypothetical protein
VAPDQATRRVALLGALLLLQHWPDPNLNLIPAFARKPDFIAGLDKSANRFQAQLLCLVHADVQSPACIPLQVHPVVEERSA